MIRQPTTGLLIFCTLTSCRLQLQHFGDWRVEATDWLQATRVPAAHQAPYQHLSISSFSFIVIIIIIIIVIIIIIIIIIIMRRGPPAPNLSGHD